MRLVKPQKILYLSLVDIRDLAQVRIKRRRNDLGLSQEAAGARVNIPKQNWARYESGHVGIDLETLQQIARALETTPEALIASEPDFMELPQEIAERSQNLSERDQQELLALIRIKENLARQSQAQRGISSGGESGEEKKPQSPVPKAGARKRTG